MTLLLFIRIACCWHDVLMMRVCAKLKNAANDCAQCRNVPGHMFCCELCAVCPANVQIC